MDLIGYLLHSLPDNERREVEAQLAADPALRARLASLRRVIDPLSLDADIDPPRGLADRVIAEASDPVVMTSFVRDTSPGPSMRFADLATICGVLFVLAALVLPAISSLRGDAGRLTCADQLRTIGVALQSYRDIENGQLPAGDPMGPLNHAGVFSLLLQARGLLPEAKLLICPTADSAVVFVPKVAEYLATPTNSFLRELHRREMAGSYGYSLGHEEFGIYYRPADESTWTPIAADRPPRPDEDTSPLPNSPNHGGLGQNVLFADGHVAWLGQSQWGTDGIYANDFGQVGAGRGARDICIGVSEATPFPDKP